jgi:hypothetical protein
MATKADIEFGEEIEAGHKRIRDNRWIRATDVDDG